MAIRYDQQFNREIARIVKNFNSKVKRLEVQDRQLLPDRVLVSDLKKEYSRRRDLKRALRDLKAFTEKGAEDIIQIGNLTTTNYQFQKDKRAAIQAKRNLTREINQIQNSKLGSSGTKSDYLINLQFRRDFLNKPLKNLSRSQLKTRAKILQQDSNTENRATQFYDNIFKMLFRSAYQAGISQDTMLPVLNQLRKLSPAQLTEAIHTDPVLKDFLDRYNIYTGVAEASEETGNELERSVERLNQALPSILKYFG